MRWRRNDRRAQRAENRYTCGCSQAVIDLSRAASSQAELYERQASMSLGLTGGCLLRPQSTSIESSPKPSPAPPIPADV